MRQPCAFALLVALGLGDLCSADELPHGLVVETVVPTGAAHRAGLRAGDVLLAWSRAPQPPANPDAARGELRSPFDIEDVETEQAPRGAVTLSGLRGGAPSSWQLPAGEWLLQAPPQLAPTVLAAYEGGAANGPKGSAWLDLAERQSADAALAAWLLVRTHRAWNDAGEWPDDKRLAALAARIASSDARVALVLEGARADTLLRQGLWEEAERAYASQQAQLERSDPESLAAAAALVSRAAALTSHGQTEREQMLLERALEIRERLAPESLAVADSLQRLARFWTRRDQAKAVPLAERALALAERLAPESLTCARAHAAASGALQLGFALDRIEAHERRALELLDRVAPGTDEHVLSLINLAILRWRLGDSAAAEEFLVRAEHLTRAHRLGPSTLARVLSIRGLVAEQRGDYREAHRLHSESLKTAEGLDVPPHRLAAMLHNIADMDIRLGDPEAAEARVQRGLVLMEAKDPHSPYFALMLRMRGQLAISRGRMAEARQACERALAVDTAVATDLPEVAFDRRCLGQAERAAGDLPRALEHYSRAVAILESARERQAGDAEQGARAVAPYADTYAEYAEVFAEAGRPADALEVLERSRALGLLQQISERDLADDTGLTRELARERREAEAEFVRQRSALGALAPGSDPSVLERQRSVVQECRRKLEDIARRVRREAPRLAAVQYPQALDLRGVRAALDPGTLLLTYSVGEQQTLLLAVEPVASGDAGVHAFHVPLGRTELRSRVDAFSSLVRTSRSPEGRRAVQQQARELFDALLRPAWSLASGAQRLLLSPDDALASLPFAALHDGSRYLAELKPVHMALSATTYAQISAARSATPAGRARVAIFGDPFYRGASPVPKSRAEVALRAVSSLDALPSARREAQELKQMFGAQAELYLGAEASEAQLRSLAAGFHVVHFASHAYADESRPMHSALVLSASSANAADAEEDGLLEAWEIASHLRLQAQLVTLSACETALGAQVVGEGLLGLTRAFLRAGARSVLGSLWKVRDEPTRLLMVRLYRELLDGQSKDEALRRAQVALLHGAWPEPGDWAGFRLEGDWR